MSLQLVIDIGLFLIYCSIFTLLLAWTWKFWMLYVNTQYQNSIKYSLLEIKLPREITKNPEAAEIFLKSVYDGGGLGTWYKENWKGALPAVTSLEIVSLEGVIHFFIRAESKFKPRIEAAIYSQYPNVEIVEWTEDYVNLLPKITRHNKEGYGFWGADWKLTKSGGIEEYGDKDKLVKLEYSGDMYPIKTYKDWGLDKNPKEENKNDPITYLLEQFGSIGKGEYFCHQILIRDAAKWNTIYSIKKDGKEEKGKNLSDLVKFEIDKYKKKWTLKIKGGTEEDEWGATKGKMVKNAEGVEEFKPFTYAKNILSSKPIPPNEREIEAKENIELIQRKMGKSQVISKMRTIYVADSGKQMGTRIPMTMAVLRSFNEDSFNTLGPDMGTFPDPFDYPWQDPKKHYSGWRKENLFGAYKGRAGMFGFSGGMSQGTRKFLDDSMFNSDNNTRKIYSAIHNIILHPFSPTKTLSGFTLNLEELATLYHFPGEVAATPTLPRIDSVKSSSPSNLPTQ